MLPSLETQARVASSDAPRDRQRVGRLGPGVKTERDLRTHFPSKGALVTQHQPSVARSSGFFFSREAKNLRFTYEISQLLNLATN